ncbi:YraN family protein [Persicimonas caeni]|uniref:UPF0102 protein FIV42_04255 n=1 Tax=Persicimonas caeni TaxID=2292766 RepID=A0A4Y6PPE8_PERCE|nr:YraN family protein [Persicimonas caeni]QDG49979.1 YraN family protein [Persicimonas caeni]QED31200.1 YraN family protein [Persicimonas caeni]
MEQTKDDSKDLDPRREIGMAGEDLAAEHMRELGWEVLHRNYTLKMGELDMVASRYGKVGHRMEQTLAFVEVKTKRTPLGPPPEASVNARKRGRLVRLAKVYLQKEKVRKVNVRFDVIAIDLSGEEPKLTHFPCAFDADGRVW